MKELVENDLVTFMNATWGLVSVRLALRRW
jgi:hypothetical protein